MTKLIVVSTLSALRGNGMIDLGEKDITSLTIGDVKQMVEERSDLDKAEQKLWWRGYVLDNELLPITKACMGVNPDEFVKPDVESLSLFLTVQENAEGPEPFVQLSRSNSFDQVRSEIMRKRESMKSCILQ